MSSIERIIREARNLSAEERQRLLEELARSLVDGPAGETPSNGQGLDLFLKLAGTAHSEQSDVSGDKYKHLGDVYSD